VEFSFQLPCWVADCFEQTPPRLASREDRMRLVINAARENVQKETGGPFGAGVFDDKGELIALGVNLVVPCRCSVLHAEIVALSLAQNKLGHYDLSQVGTTGDYELVTSTEPCAMCFGAVPWSGVKRLVCGARGEDARSIGFEEGPKGPNWQEALEARHIEVVTDVLRHEAVEVLKLYHKHNGIIYSPDCTSHS